MVRIPRSNLVHHANHRLSKLGRGRLVKTVWHACFEHALETTLTPFIYLIKDQIVGRTSQRFQFWKWGTHIDDRYQRQICRVEISK